MLPSKAIASPLDHAKFLASPAKRDLVDFVLALNKSCVARRSSASSQAVAPLVSLLDRIGALVREVPASKAAGRRFGDACVEIPST